MNLFKKATIGLRPQRLRLYSGLVLMFYATLHFINHSLGHISLEAMAAMLAVMSSFWTSLPGTLLLYGSLAVHVTLGLIKLAGIRTFKRPLWEWVQILLGLAIPFWLSTHIIFTRGVENQFGIEVDYPLVLTTLWPLAALKQNLLLLIVWVHGIIGIHFWLRLRSWYGSWFPALLAVALFIPTVAISGWIAAARRQLNEHTPPEASQSAAPVQSEQAEIAEYLREANAAQAETAFWIVVALLAIVAAVIAIRWVLGRVRRQFKVNYGDGRVVNAVPGQTLLEVSRAAGVPHMSVCGGRARCSTCRTLVLSETESLTQRTDAEAELLSKINADENIRLACQARVRDHVEIRPLIQPEQRAISPRNADPLGWGVERDVAILFLDIRGFSRISEGSLPYDIVFILNSFFGEVTTAIEASNGYIDKFMGDGAMAIFGLETGIEAASRDALAAAGECVEAATRTSRLLTQHLKQPIRIGVGVHSGQAIIGRIGRASDQTSPSRLTAIGDTVNIAARLESATKDLNCVIVFSKQTSEFAGLEKAEPPGKASRIKVHNISTPIDVIAVAESARLKQILGSA